MGVQQSDRALARRKFYKAERGCRERGEGVAVEAYLALCSRRGAQDPTNMQVFMTCLDVLVRDGAL